MNHEISTTTNQSATSQTNFVEKPTVVPEPHLSTGNNTLSETTRLVGSVEATVEDLARVASHLGTKSGLPNVLVFLLSDVISIGLTLLSVRFVMQWFGFIVDEATLTLTSFRLMMGFYGLVLIAGWYQGLYSTVVIRPAAEMRLIMLISLGLAALFGILPWMIMLKQPESLVWLTCGSLLLGIVQPCLRAGSRLLFGRMKWWGRRVLLVGCGERSASIYRMLKQSSVYGLRPIGFIEDFEVLGDGDKEGYLGPTAELAERVAEYDVNLAFVATGGSAPRPEILNLVYQPNSAIGEWLIVAEGMGGLPCLWTAAKEVAGMPALGVANRLSSPWRRHLKRALDLLIVIALMPAWLPTIGLIALLVRLNSPGKAFYSQQRLGLGGKTFRCWKLRSMVPNAEEVLHEHLAKHPELREEWKLSHKLKQDPRITWIGSFLRKTSLDEIPQLFNVLRGEMSLVGPRPIVFAEIEKYGEVYKRYELVLPGITGLWQVNGRNNTTYEDRLAFDDYYVKNWSLSLDLYIMFCTVKVVLLREGAY